MAARIITEATTSSEAWNRVAELTDRFPARVSGSENMADAIEWPVARMREDGLRGGPPTAIAIGTISDSAEAPDLGPIVREAKVPSMSLLGDMRRYFEVHPTPADTVGKIRPEEIASGVAALATMAYVVADTPGTLPR